ncbi:MAG TPA: FtsX-like permease family protein [Vicinamibacteria bacterium]|nr:FtsX-like permease family protein [Vicinamibacteria bacterium]
MAFYSVGQRTQEIGIRMALGASQRKIPWLVARQGAALVLLGMVLGLALAATLSRLLSSLLFAVGERDPLTFVAAPLLLAWWPC